MLVSYNIKALILSALLFLCELITTAQQQKIKPLTIGDMLPDLTFNNLINYSSKTAKLSDFKGKLVILDFWATWCSSCIKKLPQMDSLQKHNFEMLQIILINSRLNSEQEIKQFYTTTTFKHRIRNLPTEIGDSVFVNIFPHKSIPHYVFIKDQKVLHIGYAEDVNQMNIDRLLSGEIPIGKIKSDLFYDPEKGLFWNLRGDNASTFAYSFVFSKEISGIKHGARFFSDSLIQRRIFLNYNIFFLYQQAYSIPIKRIRNFSNRGDSFEEKQFCYEQVASSSLSTKQCSGEMVKDLDRFFNLKSQIEDIPVNCWYISVDKLTESYRNSSSPFKAKKTDTTISIKNFETIANLLNKDSTLFIVNPEIADSYPIYIDKLLLNKVGKDIREIKKVLEANHLTLENRTISYSMLVLRD